MCLSRISVEWIETEWIETEKREERENESVNYRRVRKLLTIGPTDDRAGHKEVSLTRQREREIKRKEAT